MPELPDVEIFKNYVKSTCLNKTVDGVSVTDSRILSGVGSGAFKKQLKGSKLQGANRYGKSMFIDIEKQMLMMHFGMTGELSYYKGSQEVDYARIILHFTNGYNLAYISRRMLGRIEIVSSLEDFVESNRLGPDAMAISRSDFFSVISRSKSAIKSALMNQNLIAGIGNIYADEILFQSGVHPTVKALCLDDENYRELYMNMHKVLKRAVERKADPNKMPDNYLLPHRYKDGKCPRCKGEFKTEKVGGRTAYYCPNCQKKKK